MIVHVGKYLFDSAVKNIAEIRITEITAKYVFGFN